jgi:hypothetical protein
MTEHDNEHLTAAELIVCSAIGGMLVDAAVQAANYLDTSHLNGNILTNTFAVFVGMVGSGFGTSDTVSRR